MAVDKIALLVSDFTDGGVERNFTSLAAGLAGLGVEAHLLVGDPMHPYLAELRGQVRCWQLSGDPRGWLEPYLARERPDVLLTGKLRDDLAALATCSSPGGVRGTRVVAAVGTLMSARQAATRLNLVKRWRDWRRIHHAYRRLDGITAVSGQVASDLCTHFRIDGVPLRVLPNPIVPPDLAGRAAAPCPHPWLAPGEPPVIVAVGGLRQVKDFPTLLRAFAAVSQGCDARLLILGEGKERQHLESLVVRLGVAARVALPGFVANPFAYVARSRLLALSSRREGLPNVLVEAMAVGTPVVATDCTEGVRELLGDGRLGALVPVGDVRALAEALQRGLVAPIDRAALVRAARPYGQLAAAHGYLDFFRELSRPGSPA